MAETEKANSASSVLPGTMPDRLPENAIGAASSGAAGFDPQIVAKDLLRTTRAGTLATIDRNTGHPFASLVNVATDCDGGPVILTSRLATHTANLEVDARASLLLAASGKGDPLAHPRLTVLGAFVRIARDAADQARLRRRFLARHPKSELYAGFADFSFWRLDMVSAHLNGGFARAADLTAAALLTDVCDADDLIAAEESAIAHMNTEHADAVQLYATKLCGAQDGTTGGSLWRITGIDPEGLDLGRGDMTLRLPFPQRVRNAGQLRKAVVDLAAKARAG